jgi:hypothetical protein
MKDPINRRVLEALTRRNMEAERAASEPFLMLRREQKRSERAGELSVVLARLVDQRKLTWTESIDRILFILEESENTKSIATLWSLLNQRFVKPELILGELHNVLEQLAKF